METGQVHDSTSVDQHPKHDPRRGALLQRVRNVLVCPRQNAADTRPRPGYGQVNLKNASSIAYNNNIQVQTTRWAILDWLKDSHKEGMWTVSTIFSDMMIPEAHRRTAGCDSFAFPHQAGRDTKAVRDI